MTSTEGRGSSSSSPKSDGNTSSTRLAPGAWRIFKRPSADARRKPAHGLDDVGEESHRVVVVGVEGKPSEIPILRFRGVPGLQEARLTPARRGAENHQPAARVRAESSQRRGARDDVALDRREQLRSDQAAAARFLISPWVDYKRESACPLRR